MERQGHHRRIVAALLTTVSLTVLPSLADAEQPAEDRAGADNGEIGTIVVTARRREENLQNVPDTITAFSPAVIEERRLDTIGDFLQLTPNVNITADQDAATNNISIRGLGSNRNQAAAVAFSVDGVILPDADAFTMDLSDVERLEVLKGPQGALYGKGRSRARSISPRRVRRIKSRARPRSAMRAATSSAPSAQSVARSPATRYWLG